MKYVLRISPMAHEDIKNIYGYIKKDGESIAKKQAEMIYDKLNNLLLFPQCGTQLSKFVKRQTNYRVLIINKIYLAFYKVNDNNIDVIRILRGEQDYIKELNL